MILRMEKYFWCKLTVLLEVRLQSLHTVSLIITIVISQTLCHIAFPLPTAVLPPLPTEQPGFPSELVHLLVHSGFCLRRGPWWLHLLKKNKNKKIAGNEEKKTRVEKRGVHKDYNILL